MSYSQYIVERLLIQLEFQNATASAITLVTNILSLLPRCMHNSFGQCIFANTAFKIRGFIQQFYAFVEGVSQHHRNVDDLLCKVWMIFMRSHGSLTVS